MSNVATCVCALALSCAAGAASAQNTRVVMDREWRARTIQLLSVTEREILGRDATGRPLSIPREAVLAILTPQEGERETPSQRLLAPQDTGAGLHLIDGQVFPGAPGSKPGAAESVVWDVPGWGERSFPLELVGCVRLGELTPAERKPGTADRVLLTNGDTLEGFVSEVGPVVRIEVNKTVNALPADRVRAVVLANPPVPAAGTLLWTLGGVVARVEGFGVSAGGEFSLRLPGVEGEAGLVTGAADQVRAVLLDAARVRGLAAIPWTGVDLGGGTARRWTPPPIVGDLADAPLFAADIELPGPMGVEWELPKGSRVLSGTAELPLSSRVWGDCTVTIGCVGSTPLWQRRLHAGEAVAEFRVDLPSGASRLRVAVDAGPSGPVQDRVVLRGPVLLVNPER